MFNHKNPFMNAHIIHELLRSMTESELNAAVQNSTINHHAEGMDYLCLYRNPEQETLKLYLIEKPYLANTNSGFLVHPHTHRYPFASMVLSGIVEHIRFQRKYRDESLPPHMMEHEYHPETKTLSAGRPVSMKSVSMEEHRAGGSYFVDPHEIHTLRLLSRQPVLIGLAQYPDVATHSQIYMPKDKPVAYPTSRRPTVEEVVKLRDRCLELIQSGGAL